MKKSGNNSILSDLAIVYASVVFAVLFTQSGALADILLATKSSMIIGSFVSGMFFTSIFTTIPAIVAIGEISVHNSLVVTALVGGLGAVVGDLIIFNFVRDRLSEHIIELLKHQGAGKRIKALFKLKFFRLLTFLAGGFVIASPLPDELGVSLLGFSKMKTRYFVLLSFFFNSIGILIVGMAARTIAGNNF